MAVCIIEGCGNALRPGSRMVTCDLCRANMHAWEKRRPAEILERAQRLNIYRNRMAQFAVVKDEDVTKVTHEDLSKRGIMQFKEVKHAKRRASATVVELKTRQRQHQQPKRKRA